MHKNRNKTTYKKFILMSKKYCPQCGKPLTDNALFCLHCGNEVPEIQEESIQESSSSRDSSLNSSENASDEKTLSKHQMPAVSPRPHTNPRLARKKKKLPIGYLIFLAIILFILIWLIRKKLNSVDPPPMHSLPSERPHHSVLQIDSLDTLYSDISYNEDLNLLSPSLPHIVIPNHPSPLPPEIEEYYNDDYTSDAPSLPAYTEQPAADIRPSTSIQFTTEQSVRNMLVSNRFVDPLTSDVLTFRNNGNVLLKNGDTIAVDMEVAKLSKNSAILDYYDNNKSWDIQLDINEQHKKLSWMDNTYIAD